MRKFIGIILALALVFSICGYVTIVGATGENVASPKVAAYIGEHKEKIAADIVKLFDSKNLTGVVCEVSAVEGTTEVVVKIALPLEKANADKAASIKDVLKNADKEGLKKDFEFFKVEQVTKVSLCFYTNDVVTEGKIDANKETEFVVGDPIVLDFRQQ